LGLLISDPGFGGEQERVTPARASRKTNAREKK